MRKFYLLGLTLLAACAFSAIAASGASAALVWELAYWLVDGKGITTAEGPLAAETEGGLTLENVLNGGSILCEGVFHGTVGPESADEITDLLTLGGVLVEPLDGATATGGLSCTGVKLCLNGSEVWPFGLPWKTELEQDSETGLYYDLILAPEYFIKCKTLIGTVEELCEIPNAGASEGQVLNNTTNGDVEATGSAEPLATCNGNAAEGKITADAGALTFITGKTLQVSLVFP